MRTTPADPAPSDLPPWALVVVATLFVGGHAAAALAGGTGWGLHYVRYLGAPLILAAVFASLGVAATLGSGRPRFSPWLAAAIALPLFWLVRDRGHWLGDGSVILDGAGAPLTFHEREPLSTLLNQAVLHAASRLGLEPAAGAELASCVFGALFVLLLLRLDGTLRAGGFVFALTFFSGAVQLFFGYVEMYPSVAIAVVAFLLAARAPATRVASLLPPVLLFLVALFLHLSSVVLLPAVGLLVAQQIRLRAGATARLGLAGEVAAAIALGWILWVVVFLPVEGARSIPEYLAVLAESGRYSYRSFTERYPGLAPPLWSVAHLREWLQLQLLLVPVALPLAGFCALRAPRAVSSDGWRALLAITSLGYLASQFLFFSHLGAPRDWDVLATGAFPLSLLAAVAFRPGRRTAAVLAALAAFHTIPWVLANAVPSAAQARFEEIPMPRGQTEFVLGRRAMDRADPEEAVLWFRRAIEAVPQSTPSWYALGNALERVGRPEDALEAYLRARALLAVDPRVDRGQLLERLGFLEWRLGRRADARVTLEAALDERPGSVAARVLLSYAALDDGDPRRVLALLEPILGRRGENPAILVLSARALGRLGRRDDAAAALAEASRRFPGDATVEAARRELGAGP